MLNARLKNHKATFNKRLDHFGSMIYHQMQDTIKSGYPDRSHDLFLEQSILCGWLGMKGCFNLNIIDEVISWQDDSGCYKNGHPRLAM